ncbi:MAG: pentapeptide repeat-containing protein [Chloroflexota bacterium]|nr:pentapeptide repeat-containing protein [Chloroflexota bacterium]
MINQVISHMSRNSTNKRVFFLIIASIALTTVLSAVFNQEGFSRAWFASWLQNFSTEMIGAFATYILFEIVIGGRLEQDQKERQRIEQRNSIVRDIVSSSGVMVRRAIREARDSKILTDGSLNRLNLNEAEMPKAELSGADLKGVSLVNANLAFALLDRSDLTEADLSGSLLASANLSYANLSNAELWNVDLTNANLTGADLSGAKLGRAKLHGARLDKAKFSSRTILPDAQDIGDFLEPVHDKYWSPDVDMRIYTNPN